MFNSIASRMLLSIGVLTFAMITAITTGFWAQESSHTKIDGIIGGSVQPMKRLKNVADMYAVNIVDTAWKTQSRQMSLPEAVKSVEMAVSTIRDEWASFVRGEGNQGHDSVLAETGSAMLVADKAVEVLLQTLKRGDLAALQKFNELQMYAALDPVSGYIGKLIDHRLAVAQSQGEAAQAIARRAYWIMAIVAAGGLAALVFAINLVIRDVKRPLRNMTFAMRDLSDGNLSVEIPRTRRQDEVGEMATALLVFRDNARRVRELEEQEKAASAVRLESADQMASIVADVAQVVAAAAAGDFSARLALDSADGQMQRLVTGINEINSAVDGATNEFANVLAAMAAGDLTRRVETTYRGRFAELKASINETCLKLSGTLRTVQATVGDVSLCGQEIATGSDDLSKRTEEQASALEQSAATTEELAASVKASAQASHKCVVLAGEAMAVAQTGGHVVSQAVEAMARIDEASKKISDIIRVIDDIAFQTNLLALNAAVEAARAGDAGKGFAVVASEVRTLAQRSSEAAKDIAHLISTSNAEVAEGVELVNRTGDTLGEIVQAATLVQATVSEIAAAASEQANGIEEMSQTVAHMDEMTQQNAALAEQSASSAIALTSRLTDLSKLVAAFRTGSEATASEWPISANAVRGRSLRDAVEPHRLYRAGARSA